MSDSKKSDPTEDPEFQKVVDHFLKTPPKPHEGGKKKGKRDDSDSKGKSSRRA